MIQGYKDGRLSPTGDGRPFSVGKTSKSMQGHNERPWFPAGTASMLLYLNNITEKMD